MTCASLLGNDATTRANGNKALAVSGLVAPADPTQGTVTYSASPCKFTFTPAQDFCGVAQFDYGVGDGKWAASATVYVTVPCPENQATELTPGDDDVTAKPNTPKSFSCDSVLANDASTLAGAALTVVAPSSKPANGKIEFFDSPCRFVYTPNKDYCGPDMFQYVVTDGKNYGIATVTIDMGTCSEIVAVDEAFRTPFNTPFVLPAAGVLTNDRTTLAGGELTVTGVSKPPGSGQMTLNPDGSFTYTPNTDFSGVDCFLYTVTDGVLVDEAEVCITIEPPGTPRVPEQALDFEFNVTPSPGAPPCPTDAELKALGQQVVDEMVKAKNVVGTYLISATCVDGQVDIKTGVTGEPRLIAEGLNPEDPCAVGSPLFVVCSKPVIKYGVPASGACASAGGTCRSPSEACPSFGTSYGTCVGTASASTKKGGATNTWTAYGVNCVASADAATKKGNGTSSSNACGTGASTKKGSAACGYAASAATQCSAAATRAVSCACHHVRETRTTGTTAPYPIAVQLFTKTKTAVAGTKKKKTPAAPTGPAGLRSGSATISCASGALVANFAAVDGVDLVGVTISATCSPNAASCAVGASGLVARGLSLDKSVTVTGAALDANCLCAATKRPPTIQISAEDTQRC
jgi:hypothetical protein